MMRGWVLRLVVAVPVMAAEVRRDRVSGRRKLQIVFFAVALAAIFICLMYCMNKICPKVNMYSPLELDEIRLERSRDREGVLASRIEKMKNKLTSMRKSRTEVQTRRDIAASVEEKIDKFNARGREIYGKAWEEGQSGSMPIRELVKIPESDVRAMQMEAQAIVTARKEEEKRDLWFLLIQCCDEVVCLCWSCLGDCGMTKQTWGVTAQLLEKITALGCQRLIKALETE